MTGYHPKKRLGQHFLVDRPVIDRIASLVLQDNPSHIVEIGPGQGALTERLVVSNGPVFGVEFDRDMLSRLKTKFADSANLVLIASDFLKFDPSAHALDRFTLAGNIPYNITSPVLDWCVAYRSRLERGVLMIQKEMADRVAASPGSKDWSPSALFTQLHFKVVAEFKVPATAFDPPPKVESAVITLTPIESPDIPDYPLFEAVVRASFKQRRKLLTNNLTPDLIPDSSILKEILSKMGLELTCRAEELTTKQFLRLTELISPYTL